MGGGGKGLKFYVGVQGSECVNGMQHEEVRQNKQAYFPVGKSCCVDLWTVTTIKLTANTFCIVTRAEIEVKQFKLMLSVSWAIPGFPGGFVLMITDSDDGFTIHTRGMFIIPEDDLCNNAVSFVLFSIFYHELIWQV